MSADISELIKQIRFEVEHDAALGLKSSLHDRYRRLLEHIAEQREHIRKQAEDIMTLGKLVYATENETWKDRSATLEKALAEALEPFAAIAELEDDAGRDDPEDDRIWVVQAFGCQLAELTIEDFRRAAALSNGGRG
jgi:hypothetical protein